MYDSAGNYVVTETDESGSTVSYTYDVNGNVTSVTDGEENVVNYTYDNNDQITSVKGYEDAENSYAYDEGKNISTITHNNFSYKFNYDVFSNLISTKIGNTAIVSNTYSANNGNLTKTAYANGDYIEYTYDEYDNITKLTSEEGVIAEFVYNKKGMIVKAVDNSSETTTYYYHDFSGGIICEYRQTEGGDLSYYFSYDADGNRVEKTSINGQTKTITSGTDDDGKSFVSNDGVTAESTTDDFGRTTEVKTSLGEGRPVFSANYKYFGIRTSNLVAELTQKYGSDELVKYQYTYNGNGNIEQVIENGVITAKYTYDELNQLVWSGDRNTNLYTQMVYDNAGNITRVDIYSLGSNWAPVKLLESRTYTYGDTNWCDKLTGYNGTAITYDAVGNPLSYRDGMTMSWQNGRQLASLQTNDNSIVYKYDSNGMRTRKTDSNGTTNYYYDSNNNLIGLTKGNNTLLFYYNPSGEVTSFKYNGEIYYYIKNLQGDIVKIIDRSGAEAASYKYDSWGKITAESGNSVIRELNPFRYRGYVYDTETGLYYLQSRYYDPITGRFLNADIYCDTQSGSPLSTNMFAYCENNAINNIDLTGEWFTSFNKYYTYRINKAKNIPRALASVKKILKDLKERDNTNRYILLNFKNYIFGQKNYPPGNLSFGNGNYRISSNGCGLVAIYNVMKYIKKFQYFPQVILEAEMNDMLWNDGMFGIKDEKIKSYFDAHKVKYSKYETLAKLKSNIDKFKITIVYVRNNGSLSRHYYCIVKKKGKYYSLNFYNNTTDYFRFYWDQIDSKHFIRAFCVK